MGTAILLPHDCLRNSKARHKGQISEAIFHSDRASRTRRGTLQASVWSEPSTVCLDSSRKNTLTSTVEWTPKSTPSPLHDHVSDSLQLQKEFEQSNFKANTSTEVKDTKSASNSDCDVPVFTILRRPKAKEAADELIAKFLVQVEGEKLVDGQLNQKQDYSVIPDLTLDKPKSKSNSHLKSSEMKVLRCNLKKGYCIVTAEEPKVDFSSSGTKPADKAKSHISGLDLNTGKGLSRSVAPGVAQPMNISRRESQRGFDDVLHLKGLCQEASLKAKSAHKNVKKAGLIESIRSKHLHQTQLASTVPDGLSRLKRSATDPQVVKQLAGHYRSEEVDIPCIDIKSYYGFARTASMSCPERWAGPSYYSSPAPSSLPLPKFSFRNQRRSSFQSSGEEHTSNMPDSPDSKVSSPESSPLQGGTLDVTFATKSLRRMLKLDPF